MKLSKLRNQEAAKQLIVIFSSERYDKSLEENRANFEAAKDHLHQAGIPFSIGQGSYMGDLEPCFVCRPQVKKQLPMVRAIAELYEQESMLIRTENCVFLEYLYDGSVKHIGDRLVCVPKNDALQRESYTELGGRYYIPV